MHGLLEGHVGGVGDGAGAHQDQVVIWAYDSVWIGVEHAFACLLVTCAQHYGIWEVFVQVAKSDALQSCTHLGMHRS